MLFLLFNLGGKPAGAGAAKTYGVLGFADACLLLAIALLIATGGAAALSLSGRSRRLSAPRARRAMSCTR
jgi:hypothetical protein